MAHVWIRPDSRPAKKPAENKKQKAADKSVGIKMSAAKKGDEK